MSPIASAAIDPLAWRPQPAAAHFVADRLAEFVRDLPELARLEARLLAETGTRLVDWVDHLQLVAGERWEDELRRAGYAADERPDFDGAVNWRHAAALVPVVRLAAGGPARVAIKVESVRDFLFAQGLDERTPISGEPLAPLRSARAMAGERAELWALERHGYAGFAPQSISTAQRAAVLAHGEAFWRRRRSFADPADGFAHAVLLVQAAAAGLGVDWACDLFFAAERTYWQSRNAAGAAQKARQDRLGLGWANHDHHTYRSSREHFARLIAALAALGFVCRERFYGGREAGWGAQVLEQPQAGVVIFADVDLTPDEVAGDFAHQPLAPLPRLGTVGLWCKLHGEAFLEAGLHHLEARFDFARSRAQLAALGVAAMAPFTDFAHLKQCFTSGEMWPVAPARIDAALAGGFITADQAAQFRAHGALGSHLEVLERNDGYKGFNQTGISQIILATDPRQ